MYVLIGLKHDGYSNLFLLNLAEVKHIRWNTRDDDNSSEIELHSGEKFTSNTRFHDLAKRMKKAGILLK